MVPSSSNLLWCFSVHLNSCVHILGNAVNGQGGYDHAVDTHQENFHPAGGGRDPPPLPDNQVPVVQPPRRPREHNWKLAGATECSASCGKGTSHYIYLNSTHHQHSCNLLDSLLRLSICFLCSLGFRYSIFHCVSRLNHLQVSDALCDSSSRPTPQEEACNLQPCPALWETTLPLSLHPFHPERKLNKQCSDM